MWPISYVFPGLQSYQTVNFHCLHCIGYINCQATVSMLKGLNLYFENTENLNPAGMWEVVDDTGSDGKFLPVVSDMQYSGLSSTPIVVILKHRIGSLTVQQMFKSHTVSHNKE